MSANLESLQKDYREGKIVPFIGSGLSVPFKVPTWGDLIRSLTEKHAVGELEFVKHAVELDLKRYDYWGAIDALKKYTLIEEEDIQEGITDLIQQKQIKLVDNAQHNYSDLAKDEMQIPIYQMKMENNQFQLKSERIL
ncbi:hypothetical protein ACLHDF_25815 [Priestia aryabhattai]|uniref:hypothetical protein n=1 Tax=Priestia megaterium TaxID=1404 RepID=UPI0039B9C753